jgi:hypothetical protein
MVHMQVDAIKKRAPAEVAATVAGHPSEPRSSYDEAIRVFAKLAATAFGLGPSVAFPVSLGMGGVIGIPAGVFFLTMGRAVDGSVGGISGSTLSLVRSLVANSGSLHSIGVPFPVPALVLGAHDRRPPRPRRCHSRSALRPAAARKAMGMAMRRAIMGMPPLRAAMRR